jgi:hypothetical protein
VDRQVPTARSNAGLLADRGDEAVHDGIDEILAAEEVIACGGAHFHHTLEQFEDRHIEGAATEVEHQNALLRSAFVEAICERRCRRFVEQPHHIEAGKLSSRARRFALRVTEIGWDCDDRVDDGLIEIAFCVLPELAQDEGG